MIRFISKKSLEIENLKYRIECFEQSFDAKQKAQAVYDELNTRLLTALEWNEKFKGVMEKLREEKWELEMENEFLRKKIEEMK